MKQFLKKILFSKYIYPIFRRIYYVIFKLTGGQGGKTAQAYLKELNKSEFSSLDELERIQNDKLRKLIKEVYENVPYYRRIMDERKIVPSDIRNKEDLRAFPILTKQKIRDNFNGLLNIKYKGKKSTLVMTGGTTGTPLKFYFSKHEDGVRNAHWERWKKFAGVRQFDRFMYIGMDPYAKNNPNYGGTFTPMGFYLMAAFGLNDDMMWKHLKNIIKIKPVYLRGYASACYILADFFRRNKINYPLKAVLTSSDMIYPYQKKVIEEVFSCKVFDHYGQVEDIITANECERHNGFHINMESSIVEVLDENYNPVAENEIGTLIGTQLENYRTPLIRYNIGDIGCITREKCLCGRSHIRINKLFGRKDDWIITPDGKRIGVQINQTMESLYDEILETQFIQKTKDTLIVKFVPTDKYKPENEKEFEKYIREQVGNLIKIQFQKVLEIPKTQSGKHQLIISELPKEDR